MSATQSKDSRKLHQAREIVKLNRNIPVLNNHFDILNIIGSGTFSKVFLAKLNKPTKNEKKFALKYLLSTTHPTRIENEIRCLCTLKGINNVVGIESVLHHKGQTLLILPYMKHQKFETLIWEMNLEDIQCYMSGLLTALRHTHSHDIIHRDIKPNNFLYDNKTKQCGLVDFGLAEFIQTSSKRPLAEINHANLMTSSEGDDEPLMKKAKMTSGSDVINKRRETCGCFNNFTVCKICLKRKPGKYSRAGTSGFRAPEVLFQCEKQTTAVDIWSSGAILLSLLTRNQTFFYPNTDLLSLLQICRLFGTSRMQEVARRCGNEMKTSMVFKEVDLHRLILVFRKSNQDEVLIENDKIKKIVETKAPLPPEFHDDDVSDDVIDLLKKLLDPNPETRITAKSALHHPFFAS